MCSTMPCHPVLTQRKPVALWPMHLTESAVCLSRRGYERRRLRSRPLDNRGSVAPYATAASQAASRKAAYRPS